MLKDTAQKFVDLTEKDGLYVGLSPWVKEKTPGFIIIGEKFYDLATGYSGTEADLLELLSPTLHLPELPEDSVLQCINNVAAAYFSEQLPGSRAEQYFSDRGFQKQEMKQFGLGASPSFGIKLFTRLVENGFKEDDILRSGLVKEKDGKKYDTFYNRAMFTIRNRAGQVIGFGGRVMEKDAKACKYLNSKETNLFQKRESLYMMDVAIQETCNAYILCEGYMDVLAFHKAGVTNAVASLGTALTEQQASLLATKPRVYICYDMDSAGIAAKKKAIPVLMKKGIDIRILSVPNGKDPDEWLKTIPKEEKKKALLKLLEKAQSAADFLSETEKEGEEILKVSMMKRPW